MVYLIADVEKRYCKVGYSSDPQSRLDSLQTGNPLKLEIFITMDGGKSLEKTIHRKMKKFRKQGEWFEYNEEVIKCIQYYHQAQKRRKEREKEWATSEYINLKMKILNYICRNGNDYEILLDKTGLLNIAGHCSISVEKMKEMLSSMHEEGKIATINGTLYRIFGVMPKEARIKEYEIEEALLNRMIAKYTKEYPWYSQQ